MTHVRWNDEPDCPPRREERVGRAGFGATLSTYDQERWLAAAWGSALTIIGARRGGFFGGLLAMLGSAVAIRAAMGRRDLPSSGRGSTRRLRSAAGDRRTSSATRRRTRSRRATRHRGRLIRARRSIDSARSATMNMALDTPATRARRWYEAGAISAMPSDGHRSRPAPRWLCTGSATGATTAGCTRRSPPCWSDGE